MVIAGMGSRLATQLVRTSGVTDVDGEDLPDVAGVDADFRLDEMPGIAPFGYEVGDGRVIGPNAAGVGLDVIDLAPEMLPEMLPPE